MHRVISASANVLLIAIAACLPGCTLDRTPIVGPPVHDYLVAATLRTAEGVTLRVTAEDALLAGGSPRRFAAEDGEVGGLPAAERVRSQWKRYLLSRLSDPALAAEARAVFGEGPWCAVDTEVLRTTSLAGSVPSDLTSPEIPGCTGEMVAPAGDCPSAAGTPMLAVDPPTVAFAPTPVGATSLEEVVVTISNAGAGRLCLAVPAFDLAMSRHAENYTLDATDCLPRTPAEMERERASLRPAERPSCFVRLGFAPRGPDAGLARLRLSTNDPDRPLAWVDVTGAAVRGRLAAVTDPVCFNTPAGALPADPSCRRNDVVLRNDGPGEVHVRSLSLPASATGWRFGTAPAAATVAPRATYPVPLYACAGATADSTLTVASDGEAELFDVTLRHPGSGCTP